MSVFVHAEGIKTVHAGGEGVKKWQNSVHVVVECPLTDSDSAGQVPSVDCCVFSISCPVVGFLMMFHTRVNKVRF